MIANAPITLEEALVMFDAWDTKVNTIQSLDNVFFPGTQNFGQAWPGPFCIGSISDQTAGQPGYVLFAPILSPVENYPANDYDHGMYPDFLVPQMHFYLDKDATAESTYVGFLAKSVIPQNTVFGVGMTQISEAIHTAFEAYDGDTISQHFIHVIILANLRGQYGSSNPYVNYDFEGSTISIVLKWLCPCIQGDNYVVTESMTEQLTATPGVLYASEDITRYNFIDPETFEDEPINWGYDFDVDRIMPPTFDFQAWCNQLKTTPPTPTDLEQRVTQLEHDYHALDERVTRLEHTSGSGNFVSI